MEPFNIAVTEQANSLYYNQNLVDCPKSGGVLKLSIDVATWQGLGGISKVMVGSPDLELPFVEATEVSGTDSYSAHISTYRANLVSSELTNNQPDVFIIAESPGGGYTMGRPSVIPFSGPSDAPLATYQIYSPTVGTNSPPQVGPIVGPADAVAGSEYAYQVSGYHDCQDSINDLTFAWDGGENPVPTYSDGSETRTRYIRTATGASTWYSMKREFTGSMPWSRTWMEALDFR